MGKTNIFSGFTFGPETPEYLEKRFEDHRAFSLAMWVVSTMLGPSLWIWDYVTDPVGAQSTLGLRLLYLFFGLLPLAFQYINSRHVLLILSLTFLLAGEAVFGEILNRLKDGMVYGNGGYLIFIWAPLLLLSGYSLRVNVLYLVLASATPHMLALFGFIHGFQHNHYAVLIWPTTVTMMMAHFAFTQNYWRRYQSELALKHACDTDPLTQVANRRHFLPRLSHEISRAQRTHREVSLAMIDIDNFKRVNDRYGHPTGDLVICAVANVCRTVSRNMDVVARMGGEEFAVMLPETSLSDAKLLAERIRMAVENTTVISTDGDPCHVTVSIGVAQQAPDEASQENLIRQADAALYKAKNAGRNRVASD